MPACSAVCPGSTQMNGARSSGPLVRIMCRSLVLPDSMFAVMLPRSSSVRGRRKRETAQQASLAIFESSKSMVPHFHRSCCPMANLHSLCLHHSVAYQVCVAAATHIAQTISCSCASPLLALSGLMAAPGRILRVPHAAQHCSWRHNRHGCVSRHIAAHGCVSPHSSTQYAATSLSSLAWMLESDKCTDGPTPKL